MNPAWSAVLSTVLAGLAQGLVVTLALAELASLPMRTSFLAGALALAVALLLAALAAWAVQRVRRGPAWSALPGSQQPWLSCEATVLPVFAGLCALWWLALRRGWDLPWLPPAALLLAAALWLCSAMVYACVRHIREWAQPLTLVNFVLVGMSSGIVLACALAAWQQQLAVLLAAGPIALLLTIAAAVARLAALRRCPQPSRVNAFFMLFGFGLPALLLAWGVAREAPWPWTLALLVQLPGLLAERWSFVTQAPPPQPRDDRAGR